jgi:hypothetical protein
MNTLRKKNNNIVSTAWLCKRELELAHKVTFFWTVTIGEATKGLLNGHNCHIITYGLGELKVAVSVTQNWRVSRVRARFKKTLSKLLESNSCKC